MMIYDQIRDRSLKFLVTWNEFVYDNVLFQQHSRSKLGLLIPAAASDDIDYYSSFEDHI